MICVDCGVNDAAYPRRICKPCRSRQENARRRARRDTDQLKTCTVDGCDELRYAMPSQTAAVCKAHWRPSSRKTREATQAEASMERIKQQNRDSQTRHRMRRRYGIDHEAELAKRPDGRCDACRRAAPLQVDHCHATGAFRGMLCGPCNRALGQAQDDIARLEGLAAYLRGGPKAPGYAPGAFGVSGQT